MARQLCLDPFGVSNEHDLNAAITGRLNRPSDDLYRGIVAAHRINGYPC